MGNKTVRKAIQVTVSEDLDIGDLDQILKAFGKAVNETNEVTLSILSGMEGTEESTNVPQSHGGRGWRHDGGDDNESSGNGNGNGNGGQNRSRRGGSGRRLFNL